MYVKYGLCLEHPLIFMWQAVDAMLEAKGTTALATSVVAGLGTVETEA